MTENNQAMQAPEGIESQLPATVADGHINALPSVLENDPQYLMEQFTQGSSLFFSTIVLDGTRETAIKVYNSLSDTLSLRDHINVPLNVTDYMAHPVQLLDEQTGEMFTAIRVILVTEEGDAYAAVSKGVQSSIQRLVPIVGQAPWSPALRIKAVDKPTRNAMYRVLTLQLVADVEVTQPKRGARK